MFQIVGTFGAIIQKVILEFDFPPCESEWNLIKRS